MASFLEMQEAISFLNFKKLKSLAWLTVKWAFDDVKEVQKAIANDQAFKQELQDTRINAKCTSMSKFTAKYEV